MTTLAGETVAAAGIERFRALDVRAVRMLLCDADGNLFPSEGPAFAASATVTNRVLAELGIPRRYTATELRLATTGKNFRTTVAALAADGGIALEPAPSGSDRVLTRAQLELWVADERREVTAHLARTLAPDLEVSGPLERLGRRFGLAVVSSSAIARLDACFAATGLDGLFPRARRFSAEDSLPVPLGKPDPAVYTFAARQLGLGPGEGLAIEDSVPGAESALAAGHATIGNVMFVEPAERAERAEALRDAGVAAVVTSWSAIEALLA